MLAEGRKRGPIKWMRMAGADADLRQSKRVGGGTGGQFLIELGHQAGSGLIIHLPERRKQLRRTGIHEGSRQPN